MRIKKVVTLLVIMVFILSITTSVYADTQIRVSVNDKDDMIKAIKAASIANGGEESGTEVRVKSKNKSKEATKDVKVLSYEDGTSVLTFDEVAFKQSNTTEVERAMKAFVDSLKESSIALDTQQDIMTQIQDSDTSVAAMVIPMMISGTKADLFTAYKWLSPFIPIFNFCLGVVTYILIFLLLFSTIADLAYIGLPVWRESSQEKSGGKKPFGVSYEALTTVKDVETNLGEGKYKNAYILYLSRRGLTYVMLSICILYLVAGGLSGLIAFFLNLGSGVI